MRVDSSNRAGLLENDMRNYLDAARFKGSYQVAWEKWEGAAKLLWSSDSERQLTTIGHVCREAIREFGEHPVLAGRGGRHG